MTTAQLFNLRPNEGPADRVFFRKADIREGTELVHLGRLDPGARWTVTRIWHWDMSRHRDRRVPSPETLNDMVEVHKQGGRDRLQLRFQYISYSAIWQLV